MKSEKKDELYIKVKDMAGNDFFCPLDEIDDPTRVRDAEIENCFETEVVGRYAGQLTIVEPTT